MGLSTLVYSSSLGLSWQASQSLTGTDYNPTGNNSAIKHGVSIGTAKANNAVGGGDQIYSAITSIAGAGSATLDLTSLTNIIQQAAQAFVRIKAIIVRLLSPTNDATNGTLAAFVTIGNNGANDFISQAGTGWLNTAASKIDVANGARLSYENDNAAGIAVDGTHKIIKITNGDATLSAKVQITLVGGSS